MPLHSVGQISVSAIQNRGEKVEEQRHQIIWHTLALQHRCILIRRDLHVADRSAGCSGDLPRLCVPPSDGSLTTVYRMSAASTSSWRGGSIVARRCSRRRRRSRRRTRCSSLNFPVFETRSAQEALCCLVHRSAPSERVLAAFGRGIGRPFRLPPDLLPSLTAPQLTGKEDPCRSPGVV